MLANKNNLRSELTANVGVLDTSISITAGEGILWENDMVACLEHYENGVCTKREIIKITAKSTDTFTITRGFADCIMNDETKTQGHGSQEFFVGDYLSLYLSKEIWESITTGITINAGNIETMKTNVQTLKNHIDQCCDNWVAQVGILNDSHFTNGGFGNASDGDCIVEAGNHYWQANKVYNFRNLTIKAGAVIRFEGDGVPQIKVRDKYINNGIIDTRAGFKKNCGCSRRVDFGRDTTVQGYGDNANITPGTAGTGGNGVPTSWADDTSSSGREKGCPGNAASGSTGGAGGKGGDSWSSCCNCWTSGYAGSPASGENGGAGGGGMGRNVGGGGDKVGGGGGGGGGAGRFGNGGNGGWGAPGGGSTSSWAYGGGGGGSGGNSGLWGTGGTGGQGGAGGPTTTGGHGGNGGDGYYGGNGGAGGTSARQSGWNTNHGGAGGNGGRGVYSGGRGGKPGYGCGGGQVGGNGGDAITNFYGLSINARCVSGTGCIRANGGYGGDGASASEAADGYNWGTGGNGGNGADGGRVIYAYMHGTPETIDVSGGAGGKGGCGKYNCCGTQDGTDGTAGNAGWKVVYTVGNDPTISNFTLAQDDTNEKVLISWNDPTFLPISPVQWKKTMIRVSTSNYPATITDGTLVVDSTVKDQYSETPFQMSASDNTTYYFTAFAIAQDDTMINVQNRQIKTKFDWEPTSDTYAYYKLESDLNDYSGNSRNLTASSSVSYITSPKAITLDASKYLYRNNFGFTFTTDRTFNVRIKITSYPGTGGNAVHILSEGTTGLRKCIFLGIFNGRGSGQPQGALQYARYSEDKIGNSGDVPLNQRCNIIYTYKASTRQYRGFVNGIQKMSGTFEGVLSVGNTNLVIGANATGTDEPSSRIVGNMARYIVESKTYSLSDAQVYFNKTKKYFGL